MEYDQFPGRWRLFRSCACAAFEAMGTMELAAMCSSAGCGCLFVVLGLFDPAGGHQCGVCIVPPQARSSVNLLAVRLATTIFYIDWPTWPLARSGQSALHKYLVRLQRAILRLILVGRPYGFAAVLSARQGVGSTIPYGARLFGLHPGRPLATATNNVVCNAMLSLNVRFSHLPTAMSLHFFHRLIRLCTSVIECMVELDLGINDSLYIRSYTASSRSYPIRYDTPTLLLILVLLHHGP